MANKRAQQNQNLFNQAVALGHNPQFTPGSGGKGAYTRYLQGLINQGPVNQSSSKPAQPQAPAPIKPALPPQTLGDDNGGSKLKINKKAKRRRKGSGAGTGSLRINLNAAPTGASAGGVNVGGG